VGNKVVGDSDEIVLRGVLITVAQYSSYNQTFKAAGGMS
jgi:hypothetical protein